MRNVGRSNSDFHTAVFASTTPPMVASENSSRATCEQIACGVNAGTRSDGRRATLTSFATLAPMSTDTSMFKPLRRRSDTSTSPLSSKSMPCHGGTTVRQEEGQQRGAERECHTTNLNERDRTAARRQDRRDLGDDTLQELVAQAHWVSRGRPVSTKLAPVGTFNALGEAARR